jgi:hypothetical protein
LIVRVVKYPVSGAASANVNRQGWQELSPGNLRSGARLASHAVMRAASERCDFRTVQPWCISVLSWCGCNLTELEGKR